MATHARRPRFTVKQFLAWLQIFVPGVVMRSIIKQSFWQYGLTVLTTAVFIITAVFSQNSTSVSSISFLKKFSSTLAVLRILQGFTSALTTLALNQTLESIQWSLVSQENGLRLLNFLSISPTTGIVGMLKMAFLGKRQPSDQVWTIGRWVSSRGQ